MNSRTVCRSNIILSTENLWPRSMFYHHQPRWNVARWQINLQFLSMYKMNMCCFNGPTRDGQVYLYSVAGDRTVSIETANEEAVNTGKTSLYRRTTNTCKPIKA
jgi:hypothetical protein